MKPVVWMASYQWRTAGGRWHTAIHTDRWQSAVQRWIDDMRERYEDTPDPAVEHRNFTGPLPLCVMKETK